jgi:hypothetical protein
LVSTLDSRIRAAFAARLEKSAETDAAMVQALSDLLGRDKLPKPEELLKMYTVASEGADT